MRPAWQWPARFARRPLPGGSHGTFCEGRESVANFTVGSAWLGTISPAIPAYDNMHKDRILLGGSDAGLNCTRKDTNFLKQFAVQSGNLEMLRFLVFEAGLGEVRSRLREVVVSLLDSLILCSFVIPRLNRKCHVLVESGR